MQRLILLIVLIATPAYAQVNLLDGVDITEVVPVPAEAERPVAPTREEKVWLERYKECLDRGEQERKFIVNYWSKLLTDKLVLGDNFDFPKELCIGTIERKLAGMQKEGAVLIRGLKFPLKENDFGTVHTVKVKGVIYPVSMINEGEIRPGEFIATIFWVDSSLTERVIVVDNKYGSIKANGQKYHV